MAERKPGSPIPASLYQAMKDEYQKKRLNLIKEQLGIDDTRKIWFSKKTIDELFKAAGATEENSDKFGLEIHYGVVPEDRQGVPIPDECVGLHNVILTATNDDSLLGDEDKDIAYDNGTMCPPLC
ncbi:hypothetical protein [Desertivirga brevis]|uniref:hypothetical protein n=1 Tax=Desertivirga brevis TaxID=2810310 RepID=UPI001A972A5F|nr:hypothetical protein [Pedobacter sp. SYSU D00873]